MTEHTRLQQQLQKYRQFEKETVEPFLQELWYLRAPAFTAVLSFFFFAFIDQTQEVYRVFAQNPSPLTLWYILLSFGSIFILSLFICYHGVALAFKRVAELDLRCHYKKMYYKQKLCVKKNVFNIIKNTLNGFPTVLSRIWQYLKNPRVIEDKNVVNNDITLDSKAKILDSKAKALLFLPRLLGFLPLLALGFGLFLTLLGEGFGLFRTENTITWVLGILLVILIIALVLCLYSYERIGIVVFYSVIFGLIPFLVNTIITYGPQCGKPIFNSNSIFNSIVNQNIGCQLPSLLNLFIGILFTVVLLIWYSSLDISRGEVIPKKSSLLCTLAILRGGKTLALSLLWVIFYCKKNQSSSKSSDSCFNLNPSSDLLFIPIVVVLSISLSIIAFSIFSFPLITNELANSPLITLARLFAIIFFLVILYLIPKLFDLDNRKILLILFISTIVLLWAAFKWPNPAPYIGSINIIALFLIIFVTVSSTIFYWGYKTRIPFIPILLILALAIGFFGRNDNHHLRVLPINSEPLPSLETQFKEWINYRKDEIIAFKKPYYPIYVVSAQGGGIFAAYHAASTLSRLQDLCPAFAHHVFAISGVSGGSLGATAFSSLVKSEQPQFIQDCLGHVKAQNLMNDHRGPLENHAHQLLDQDLLSPLLAAGLFPDFFQRFFPFAIGALDRARGLEYAFEQGWKSEWNQPNPLTKSFYEHWNPKKSAPALVLNTTVVETGERLLLSPFTFKTKNPPKMFPDDLVEIRTVACQIKNNGKNIPLNFRLSTAAVLSARFPFVTPVGWFNRCDDEDGKPIVDKDHKPKEIMSRLADGGYFENSGFTTAFEIGQGLEKILADEKYKLVLMSPSSEKPFPLSKITVVYLALTDNSPSNQQSGGSDLFSPINALFSSREARGRSIIEQAEYKIDGHEEKNLSQHHFRQFYLTHYSPDKKNENGGAVNAYPLGGERDNSNFKLPLGWYLSKFSQEYMRDRIGNPDACQSDKPPYPNANNNHCVMQSIIHELSLSSIPVNAILLG